MKFDFPYEKLLDHRKTLEEIARKEFMIAKGKVDDAEAELRKMYDDVTASRQRAGDLAQEGGTQGASLVQVHDFIEGQKVRINRQREKIQQLMIEAEEKKEALVEAAKETKTLEKLKERRYKEFKLAAKKKELKEVDEMVTTRFKREDF
jgi:flagellar protein FliJ